VRSAELVRERVAPGLELLCGVWAHACDRKPVGHPRRDLGDVGLGHLVEQRDHAIGVDRLSVKDGLLGGVTRHRPAVLERDRPSAGGVGPRALDLA
jgi:hypothetical protein